MHGIKKKQNKPWIVLGVISYSMLHEVLLYFVDAGSAAVLV